MLVYGDHRDVVDARALLDEIAGRLDMSAAPASGIDRHSKLVAALIAAGQLVQAVEDQGKPSPELTDLLHSLAQCVVRSCDSRFADLGKLPRVPRLNLPSPLEPKLPEGFAFYAVYPEAYIEAARRLRLSGPPRVIGLRSIGTTLAAIVAAALGAPPAVNVRPFGEPFQRRVQLPAAILERAAHYVIVDEGPGLSGSSFGSVADWLEARGIGLERIAFLPSHAGDPGPQASKAHLRRWKQVQRVSATFSPAFLASSFGPLDELAAGGPWARRKFLAGATENRILLKFAGLGSIGERKLEIARALHAAGLTSEPLGLLHGFLAERWHSEGKPLGAGEKPLEEIGRYIGARARLFAVPDDKGASIEELRAMCRRNISLALGGSAAAIVERWDARDLSPRIGRVRTDNKLDREEWLRLPSGRLIKTDALDHHQAHDLIGCQDPAFDVAGAIAEFELDAGDTERLIRASGLRIDPQLLEFYRLAYCSFRVGQAELASDRPARQHYARGLHLLLHQNSLARESREILG